MFGAAIVAYLFLGGVGGGLCAVLSLAGLTIPHAVLGSRKVAPYRRYFRTGYLACAVILFCSIICLLVDSGNHAALIELARRGIATYLSLGAYALTAALALSVLLAYAWSSPRALQHVRLLRAGLVVACICGMLVALYTGLYLADLSAVPLWHGPWIPVLFVVSSVSCGAMCCFGLAELLGLRKFFSTFFRSLARMDGALIVVEVLVLAVFLVSAWFGASNTLELNAAHAGVAQLVSGSVAPVFWIGVVGLGIAGGLVFDSLLANQRLRHDTGRSVATAATLCPLIGSLSLRYAIVVAGASSFVSVLGA